MVASVSVWVKGRQLKINPSALQHVQKAYWSSGINGYI